MYTREEISKQKHAFWTAFGKYMKPILSADAEVVSWSNYKTGIPGLGFKLEADQQTATVAIVITAGDAGQRQRFYTQLAEQRPILAGTLGEDDWEWLPAATDEYGRPVSIVRRQLVGVSVIRTEDWPAIISFFKARITGLDEYWSMAKYGFQSLL